MLPADLPATETEFHARFGTDQACRDHLFGVRWPDGFCCVRCEGRRCYVHKKRIIYECTSCKKQHSLLAGTIFEQTKSGLAKWFLAIFHITVSKRGLSAGELQRRLGFGSDQTAWTWMQKIRRAMVAPGRIPLTGTVEADETFIGGPKPGTSGRGAAGKVLVAGAVETLIVQVELPSHEKPLRGIVRKKAEQRAARLARKTEAALQRCLGRCRLAVVPDASGASLEAFLAGAVAPGATVTTDAWKGYYGLAGKGFAHNAINISKSSGKAHEYLPAVHLVFSLVERWLLGTHHGAVTTKYLQRYLDEYVFRFSRRRLRPAAGRLHRLVEIAMQTPPAPYWRIVGRQGPS